MTSIHSTLSIIICLSAMMLISTAESSAIQQASAVFENGKIWTVDPQNPEVEAVAVLDGKIIATGTTREIRKYIGKITKVVDLKGKRMLPGFIDNHAHFMSGGFQLKSIDLRDTKSPVEFADRIRVYAEKNPGKWITGGDWDHENWPGAALPTKEMIDAFTPNTPVMVQRYDGHMALANSCALKMAGITAAMPDPPGGSIVKNHATGEPTGILKDEAMGAVYRLVPDATEEDRLNAARQALAEARKNGITSVQDLSSFTDVKTYKTLQQKGELSARMYCRIPLSQYERVAKQFGPVPSGDAMIRTGSLKAFADGSLGSSTALFFEPYVSDTTTRGLPSDIVLDKSLERWSLAADQAHLQLSIHAIGDSANSLVLDLFEKIARENPVWDRRFRIEHAQHIAPKDFQRFADLKVIASVQPYHAIDDGRWAEKRIGHERCKTTYPFRSFLDHGVKLCFGSDWTVAPLNALLGMYAAVTRRTTDGAHPDGWFPEQKISVREAIECYTINNAYAAFEEKEKGSIAVGKYADFVVLSDDLLTIDPVKIENMNVEMTVLGGEIIYQRK